MQPSSRTSLLIDKSRIEHNLNYFAQMHPLSKITPVLKANAYGHGMKEIVSIIDGSFDYFAVATLDECQPYLGCKTTFKILHGPMSVQELQLDNKVVFVIGLDSQLEMIDEYGRCRCQRYWLKVDLGLNRLGFSIERARKILTRYPNLFAGILGHLGAVDRYPDLSFHQGHLLQSLAKQFNIPLSLENTEGFARWGSSSIGDYVRLGLAFYGYSKELKLPLLPIAQLHSRVLKTFSGGNKLMGYDWTERTDAPVCLASIGYGDGLSPHLSGMVIDNERYRLKDPVMMDLCYLELLSKEPTSSICWFGRNPESLINIAKYLRVKPYVVLTQLTHRVKRVMVNSSVLSSQSPQFKQEILCS